MYCKYHVACLVRDDCVRMCCCIVEELFYVLHCFLVGVACWAAIEPSAASIVQLTAIA